MSPAPPERSLGDAPAPLQPTDSFRHAARVAMRPQVARLLELEAALRNPDAGDDLKRYRVATRRLRAALRVFEDALPKRVAREVGPDLRDLARAVGRVRDLDVRIAGLVDWASERGATSRDEVAPLRTAWEGERAAAAAEMEQRLMTKAHVRLLDRLAKMVRDAGAPKPRARAVRDHAGSAVWAGFERLRTSATDLADADLDVLHDLRIRAKRLRYTLEFLEPVLGADQAWLVTRLVELQDHLGALNDAHLAAGAAHAFLEAEGSGLTDAQRATIEAYRGARMDSVARLRDATPKVASRVIVPGFARRLSQAVLGPDTPQEASA